jgi:hypothetical protein
MMPIRIALPDMISDSYFPVLAACELGFLRSEGLDASLVLMSPADKASNTCLIGANPIPPSLQSQSVP